MSCKPTTTWGSAAAPTNTFDALAAPTSSWTSPADLASTFSACCTGDTPEVPSNVVAATVSISEITVTWDAIADATSYEVKRAGVVVQTGISGTSFADTGLAADTSYSYEVRACGASGCSAWGTAAVGVTDDWTSIANRVLWLDATADADITGATDVSAWADHSGNGRTVVQAVGAKQPNKLAAGLNGLQMVHFDGSNDSFAMASWAVQLNLGSTVFIVAIPRFDASAVKNFALIRWMPSNANGMQCESTADAVVASRNRLEAFTDTNIGLVRATPVAQVDRDVARLACSLVDPTVPAITLYRDGVAEGGPTAGFATITSSAADQFKLCMDETGSWGPYDIGEIAVFSRALTTLERVAVEQFLMTRWGL